MRRFCLTVVAVSAALNFPPAQPKQGEALLDSLLAELPKMKDDTNKVNLLGEISYRYGNVNPDKGIQYAQQESELSLRINWRKGIGLAYNDLGGSYINKSDYPAAMDHFLKALRIFEELGEKDRIGAAFGNVGLIYIQQKNYPKALEYQFKQLRIVEEQQDKKRMPGVLANIARV